MSAFSSLPISPDRRIPDKADKLVIGSAIKAFTGSAKLLRLLSLHKALPSDPSEKHEYLAELTNVWNKALKMNETSSQEARNKIEIGLRSLGPRISSIYLPEFADGCDMGGKIIKFLKDTQRVSISPLKRSARGNKGPTFLMGYSTINEARSCVIKWSHLNELVSNRVYDEFSRCFSDDPEHPVCCGYSVPFTARFDFESHLHESALGKITRISPELSASVQQNFSQLAKTFDPKLDPKSPHLMLAERVSGQNLIDFAYTNYKDLSKAQRKKFFERLGRIAMLDLLLGNIDRLIQIHHSDDDFQLSSSLEVNLGNVMVDLSDSENFHLYAIDNGIQHELVEDGDARIKYVKFLHRLFSQTDPYTPLVQNIVDCFENALQSQIDDIDDDDIKCPSPDGKKVNLKTVRDNLKPFVADLKTIAPEALRLGLAKMADWLAIEVLPNHWEKAPQATRLQSYLSEVYPEYLKSIQERLHAFRTARSK